MKRNKCRTCKTGKLKIIGVGYYGDTIEVECKNEDCQDSYEVEPDGLGMGGLELVYAMSLSEGDME
jgi:hypothetical protein